MVDTTERLQVLFFQESSFYQTSDYLTRMQSEPLHKPKKSSGLKSTSAADSPSSTKKRKSLLDSTVDDEATFATYPSSPKAAKRHNSGSTYSYETASETSQSQINKHWREKICEWAFKVVDHFDLHREVVSIMMNHLDRYLASCPTAVDKNLFQLLAMTCLYLAIKLNEYKHLLIPGSTSSMDTIIQLSRGSFTLTEMENMEYDVLQRLRWRVHPPTPQLFVKYFLSFLSQEEQEIHGLAQFLVELSAVDYFFVSYKPSDVAIAALLNAREILPCTSSDNFLGFLGHLPNTASVLACQERLALIYAQANDSNDASTHSPTKGPSEPIQDRTTSPVSVMGAPEPVVATAYRGFGNDYSDTDEELQ